MPADLGTAPPEPDKPYVVPKTGLAPKGSRCRDSIDLEELIAARDADADIIEWITDDDYYDRVLYTNEDTKGKPPTPVRRSKGAQLREVKEARRALYDAGIRAQQEGVDFENMGELSRLDIGREFMARIRSRGYSNSGRHRSAAPPKQDPWKLVRLTQYELDQLINKALADGHLFLPRPEGWQGQWFFAPSPDKIDPTGPYTFDNLRMVPWIENRARGDGFVTLVERYVAHRGKKLGLVDPPPSLKLLDQMQDLGGLSIADRNAIDRLRRLAVSRKLAA